MSILWLKEHGLKKPIVVTDAKGLDFKLPDPNMSVSEFCEKLGSNIIMSSLRVKAQSEIKVKMEDWAQHFAIKNRPKNDPSELRVPTLVIGDSELGEEVDIPNVPKINVTKVLPESTVSSQKPLHLHSTS